MSAVRTLGSEMIYRYLIGGAIVVSFAIVLQEQKSCASTSEPLAEFNHGTAGVPPAISAGTASTLSKQAGSLSSHTKQAGSLRSYLKRSHQMLAQIPSGSEHGVTGSKHSNADSSKELPPGQAEIDLEELRNSLKTSGLVGEIHAADPSNRQFVFTYRHPKDFFTNVQIGMITHNDSARDFFKTMKRHDRVKITGDFIHQGEIVPESPQPHVEVSSIEMVKKYESPIRLPENKFAKTTILPQELLDKGEADFLVHANVKNGAALVLEYKDNFVFLTVPAPKLAAHVYRNDRVHIRFTRQKHPKQPMHLELESNVDGAGNAPLVVTDSIKALHGKRYSQKGNLVRFPKSPQINRDIWAVEQKGPNGNSRTFTLVNFTKKGEQEKIDAKLKGWWETHSDSVIDGRNKLVNTKIEIVATGKMNVVDPNQANAQMRLHAKDLKLVR